MLDIGASKAIDALIAVADNTNVSVPSASVEKHIFGPDSYPGTHRHEYIEIYAGNMQVLRAPAGRDGPSA